METINLLDVQAFKSAMTNGVESNALKYFFSFAPFTNGQIQRKNSKEKFQDFN